MTSSPGFPLAPCSRSASSSAPARRKPVDAIAAALPVMLGAMGRNASQPDGADSLFGALGRDHNGGGGLGDVLGAVLGGQQRTGLDQLGLCDLLTAGMGARCSRAAVDRIPAHATAAQAAVFVLGGANAFRGN